MLIDEYETKYLIIKKVGASKSGKTYKYIVTNKTHKERIGAISWYGPWRQYCFYPDTDTIWNKDCLKNISEFIESLIKKS